MEKIGLKLKCPKCKYSWITKGRLLYTTCPNCQRKFPKPQEKKEIEVIE